MVYISQSDATCIGRTCKMLNTCIREYLNRPNKSALGYRPNFINHNFSHNFALHFQEGLHEIRFWMILKLRMSCLIILFLFKYANLTKQRKFNDYNRSVAQLLSGNFFTVYGFFLYLRLAQCVGTRMQRVSKFLSCFQNDLKLKCIILLIKHKATKTSISYVAYV